MIAEVIIASRGEDQSLLERTVDQVVKQGASVHVVHDGCETPEPRLAGVRVSTPWRDPRGCGQARHFGIMQSKADIVILIDGHMTFPAGWLDKVVSCHKRNKSLLACCQTQGIDRKDMLPDSQRIYSGAFLAIQKRVALSPGYDTHAIAATWNPDGQQFGHIGAVMGACYSMRRSFYGRMGEPLSILDEWGGDEEILSIAAHLSGGLVKCLPIVCGHVFGAPRINRIDSPDNVRRRHASRLAVLTATPMSDILRIELANCLDPRKTPALDSQRMRKCLDLRAKLAAGSNTFDDLVARGLARRLTDEEAKEAAGFRAAATTHQEQPAAQHDIRFIAPVYRETIVAPPSSAASTCKACGSVGKLERLGGLWRGYSKCKSCGHKQVPR